MTSLSGDTAVLDRPSHHPELDHDDGRATHIVQGDGDKSGPALVTEARIFGTEVQAICGHRWVPQHDPKQYPLCERCKELWRGTFGDDGENITPA